MQPWNVSPRRGVKLRSKSLYNKDIESITTLNAFMRSMGSPLAFYNTKGAAPKHLQ